MGREDHRNQWDDDPIGIVYNRPRRVWRRERHLYIALISGLLSAVLIAGALLPFSGMGLLSGLALSTAALGMVATDRAADPRWQQRWLAASIVAFVVSLIAFILAG